MIFSCLCSTDGRDRCELHAEWWCHAGGLDVLDALDANYISTECPPCRLARLRSVTLDSRATPTRRGAK